MAEKVVMVMCNGVSSDREIECGVEAGNYGALSFKSRTETVTTTSPLCLIFVEHASGFTGFGLLASI